MNPLFSRLRTQASPAPVRRLARLLDQADAVVVGAGSGLSTSAGFVYGGERFQRYFSDFGAKYGFQDMYTGGFSPSPPWRNIGPTGAGWCGSTATRMPPSRCTKPCGICW